MTSIKTKNAVTVADLIQFLSNLPADMLVLTYNSLGEYTDGSGYAPLLKDELTTDLWDGVFDYDHIETPQRVCKLGLP